MASDFKQLVFNHLHSTSDILLKERMAALQNALYMKQSAWTKAISSFLKAEELEPEGPAKECRLMLIDIMEFYNKDMFNQ